MITFSEFLDWVQYLEQDEQRRTKQDFYLAQIAAEVKRAPLTVAGKKKVKVEQFYARFSDIAPEDRMKRSKSAWGAMFNLELN